MLRFAISPTGDMHIGNLRVAIFNYLISKQNNEALIVRIQESDKEQNIEGKDQEILDILGLFGIEYQEVIYQSNNLRHHRAMALQLLHEKEAFNCFCSPETLQAKREAAEAAKKVYHYDGACENLPAELVIDNMNPFVIRIKKPKKALHVSDIIRGDSSFEPDVIDSFIILDKDKNSTYNFACSVDDMISDISSVICSEDSIDNTPRQIAIRQALGYDKEIKYAHLPTILDDTAWSIKQMLEEGFLPEAIINYLILLGNTTPKEIFTLKEAQEWFSLENISQSPLKFDIEKLRSINRQHLKMLDDKELSRYVGFADDDIGKMAKIYLDEVSTLKELRAKIEPIFAPKIVPVLLLEQADTIRNVIQAAPYFEEFEMFQAYLVDKSGLQGELLVKPLRLLLTGAEDGADVSELYPYLKNYLEEIIK